MLPALVSTEKSNYPIENWNAAPASDPLWLSALKVTLVAALGFAIVAAIGLPLAVAAGIGGAAGLAMLAWNCCCCCPDGSASYFPSAPILPPGPGYGYSTHIPAGGGHMNHRSFSYMQLPNNPTTSYQTPDLYMSRPPPPPLRREHISSRPVIPLGQSRPFSEASLYGISSNTAVGERRQNENPYRPSAPIHTISEPSHSAPAVPPRSHSSVPTTGASSGIDGSVSVGSRRPRG